MANALFDRGRQAFLDGEIAWSSDLIKLIIVDHTDDTPVVATDEDLADIDAGARVATSAAFGTKTVVDGTADAADIVLASITGDAADSIVIYFDSTVEATSLLIAFIDTATGLPTPVLSSTTVTITWDSGADKIFTL